MYDEKGVVDRFGFFPELLPDYKGLRGDPSDNIIGISGIGEKTATILINKFGFKNLLDSGLSRLAISTYVGSSEGYLKYYQKIKLNNFVQISLIKIEMKELCTLS